MTDAPKSAVTPAPEEIRSFSTFITAAEDGQLHGDLTEVVREIIEKLTDTSKEVGGKPKASLTLNIDFTLEGGVIEVKADYKTKMPRLVRQRSIFWVLANNNLSKSNPRQMSLPLRDVTTGESTTVRSV